MTIQVQAPDGSVVDFPDGTPDDVMARAMQETFGAPSAQPAAAEPSSWAGDVMKSAGTGVVRGLAETAMLPVTAKRLSEKAVNAGLTSGEDLLRAIFGAAPADPAARAAALAPKGIDTLTYGAQDAVRGGMDSYLHTPETTTGKYAETIGEFAAPGGLPSKSVQLAPTLARKGAEYAADFVRHVVTPAAISETAGQVTKGTAAEPYARIAGALLGNVGGAAVQAYTAPEAALRRAMGDPSGIDWARAIGLQDNGTGIRLTGPEAIAQAQGGGSALPNLQRVVEGSTEGRALTAPFFTARPGQVDNAVTNVLDMIAPQSSAPSQIGPRLSAAAEAAMANTPEGQALADAIFGVGPRVTPLQAGEVIQPNMRAVYDRREGMRNALADADYEAARRSEPTIPVDSLNVDKTVRKPGYTRIDPGEDPITGMPQMQPTAVPPQIETPSMTSRTGPDFVQADVRPVVKLVDRLSADARLETAKALSQVRNMLYRDGGVDTSIRGLDSARGQISDMINAAKNDGQMQTAKMLSDVQAKLDEALNAVPAYNRATEGFKAASEPLRPFESPGLAATIAKDEYGRRFTLPPENVPGALSTPSEARNFVSVAPPEARDALGQRIATDLLDKATDGSGLVSGERLRTLLRENQDVLAAYPEIADRLAAVAKGDAGMEAVRNGPLGRLSATGDTREAGNVLLPPDPLSGSQDETTRLVLQLLEQDPAAVGDTVRQALGDRYSRAATETQGGSREFAGSKFHKSIAGNEARQGTLDAVLSALANKDVQPAMTELLDVLQATGRRAPIGSGTSFNSMTMGDLGTASLPARVIDTAKTLGASFVTQAGDAAKRVALRNSIGQLADMFTDPNSVELIRSALARKPSTLIPSAVPRSLVQSQTSRQPGETN